MRACICDYGAHGRLVHVKISIMPPIHQISVRFFHLRLEVHMVEVRDKPEHNLDHVQWTHDALLSYEKDYSPTYHTTKELINMTQPHKLLNYTDHLLIFNYTFELRLCGNPNR